ncbi:unnamed protein product, partial [Discosporangium mesarthrocarpum]
VLGVIRKGVFAELEKDVYQDVQAITHVLQLRHPEERFKLMNITINTLPSMYVRGFKQVASNIVDYFAAGMGTADPELNAKIAEVGEMVEKLLPDWRVDELSKEADDWAAEQAKGASLEVRRVKELEAEKQEMGRRAAAS